MNYSKVILCDFDDTVTETDVCDNIMTSFSPPCWKEIGKEYDEKKISHLEMSRRFVSLLNVGRKELKKHINLSVRIREGFENLVAYCRSENIPLVIVSNGWDLYIQEVLQDFELNFVKDLGGVKTLTSTKITVICNELEFLGPGKWALKHSSFPSSKESSPDKERISIFLREIGINQIYCIGDGSNDVGLALSSDLVFARKDLKKHHQMNRVKFFPFVTFNDVLDELKRFERSTIRILSLPSYHPFTSRLSDSENISIVNPGMDVFGYLRNRSKTSFEQLFSSKDYDLVHIHFEYSFIALEELKEIIAYLKRAEKPIVWTCHDRRNQFTRIGEVGHEKLLYKSADQVMTLTQGCADWLLENFGPRENRIKVVRHGYIAHPAIVSRIATTVKKDKKKFILFVGEMRDNKETDWSIKSFIEASYSCNVHLHVYATDKGNYDRAQVAKINKLKNHASNPQLTLHIEKKYDDNDLVKIFLSAHAVILPYMWSTHSGQLELGRDCGCHILSPDVGFLKKQWGEIHTWEASGSSSIFGEEYKKEICKVSRLPSPAPAGLWRVTEFNQIMKDHLEEYRKLLKSR